MNLLRVHKKLFKIDFIRRFLGFNRKMNSDSDSEEALAYSQRTIEKLIQEKGRTKGVYDYLSSLKYPPVKDFAEGLEWFNVSEPLYLKKHLKGKIVVLDFFTYCCINCMHIIPDLREIEEEFSVEDGLVVIGVHSAKFENEKVSSNILAAVQRYNIAHPVVNDYNSLMWKNCEVHCWPTLLMLGPHGNPIVMLTGEGHKESLNTYIREALDYYKEKKEISDHKLPFKSAYHLLPDLKGPLLFPGKITSILDDNNKELIAISDTGNNRILILKEDGTIIHQIGGHKVGFKDGDLETAEFNNPQGLVFQNQVTIFVADTENHAVRKIDLRSKTVETVAGNGAQGNDRAGGNLWSRQIISSPWDVCIYKTDTPPKDVLIIAMAGTHQIWALFLEDTIWWKNKMFPAGSVVAIAGSGAEQNRNNQYPHTAAFAQPSGLALSVKNKELYIADSESSTVRKISLSDGKVMPVVGGDRNPYNLFAFGDKDGSGFDAKLQHSLGVATSKDEKSIYVADTYNHKLKKIDAEMNYIKTLLVPTGDTTDGEISTFNEPAGLCVSADGTKLYVADTNNHSIKVLSLDDKDNITGVKKLWLKLLEEHIETDKSKYQVLQHKNILVNSKGGKAIFNVKIDFKDGLDLTQDAPQKWYVDMPNATWCCVPNSGCDLRNIDFVLSIPNSSTTKVNSFDIIFSLVTCTSETCLPKNFLIRTKIDFIKDGKTSVYESLVVTLNPNNVTVG